MDRAYGYRNYELGIKHDSESMYLLGSANKFVTGMIIKQLEEEGKIHLDDNVNRYIPLFHLQQNYPITVRDLVLHTSGLPKLKANPLTHGLDSAIEDIKAKDFDPYTYHLYNYNDVNYIVLAKIIENVTHQPFQKSLDKYIIQKLNLKHTSLFDSTQHHTLFVKGYELKNNQVTYTPTRYLDKYYGAGNVYISTNDMAKIVLNFKNGHLLNKNSTQNLLAPAKFNLYPGTYRYGFYNYPKHQRYRGLFYKNDFVTYSNKNYVVSIASNKLPQPYDGQLEKHLKHIFTKILNQKLS
ncbi:serine hydrolase domain-containing protein [Mammaliicoccus sp. Dog046]|uniref:serine hydrolase domain-containing protein n=1 Tax=Mammaliicoccus sp. Dog046 TaxID=3034233 RepID=UPI002B2609F6|nr:serine hydrolase domain-containing protein [Mammaliicoccus sp. Dog046]WQK84766.1 serine hydrolase domain-containing protein [Mammaliicoccus sp. Dog046]